MLDTLASDELRPGVDALASLNSSGEPTSLRHFIQVLDDAGLLVRVREEVDWRFEIGRMTRESRAPLLFENVKDYPGQRVFTNGLCDTNAIGLALGLEFDTRRKALVAEVKERIATPVKPRIVSTAPILENIVHASDIDLLKLPVPHWSECDAGRYLGTWHINVTREPETGARNVGVYRMQLLGPKQATVSASPRSHLARHFAKAERAGQPLPMAVAIGVSESVLMSAAAAYPDAMDEYELAGALQQEADSAPPMRDGGSRGSCAVGNRDRGIDSTGGSCHGWAILRLHRKTKHEPKRLSIRSDPAYVPEQSDFSRHFDWSGRC